MNRWAYAENIAIVAAMVFLVWLTGSGWWGLLMLWLNYQRSR